MGIMNMTMITAMITTTTMTMTRDMTTLTTMTEVTTPMIMTMDMNTPTIMTMDMLMIMIMLVDMNMTKNTLLPQQNMRIHIHMASMHMSTHHTAPPLRPGNLPMFVRPPRAVFPKDPLMATLAP